jgi:hypothetical protein
MEVSMNTKVSGSKMVSIALNIPPLVGASGSTPPAKVKKSLNSTYSNTKVIIYGKDILPFNIIFTCMNTERAMLQITLL